MAATGSTLAGAFPQPAPLGATAQPVVAQPDPHFLARLGAIEQEIARLTQQRAASAQSLTNRLMAPGGVTPDVSAQLAQEQIALSKLEAAITRKYKIALQELQARDREREQEVVRWLVGWLVGLSCFVFFFRV